MSNLHFRALAGLTAFAAAASAAQGALALDFTVNGGGSSLISVFLRTAGDCYGAEDPLYRRNAAPLDVPGFNYAGSLGPPQDCSVQQVEPQHTVRYVSAGSGRGIGALFSHDASLWADIDTTSPLVTFPSVQYAMSDAGLDASAVDIYNNGGTIAIGNNVSVSAPGGGFAGGPTYFNPREKYGPLIQFPVAVTPVVISYDPTYKKIRTGGSVAAYHFNLRPSYARADGSGGLRLDADLYCRIFNGLITNWNDTSLLAANGFVRLKDPADPVADATWDSAGLALQIVGRADSSGTTSIWTRHLAAVCGFLGVSNQHATGATTLPPGLVGATYASGSGGTPPAGETAGLYTVATGNEGVAEYVAFTRAPPAGEGATLSQGRIGYLGPDFALPYVGNTGANGYGLHTATLKNAAGKWKSPTPVSVAAAFSGLAPPAGAARAQPDQWVQGLSPSVSLANPLGAAAYPIVGTTNMLTYQCVSTLGKFSALRSFLKFYESSALIKDTKAGILARAGLAPVPSPWRAAIYEAFVSGKDGLDLELSRVGAKAAAAACAEPAVVGG